MGIKMRGMKTGMIDIIFSSIKKLKFEYINIEQDYIGHTFDVTDPHKRSLFHNNCIKRM